MALEDSDSPVSQWQDMQWQTALGMFEDLRKSTRRGTEIRQALGGVMHNLLMDCNL
jgi:hypothetical protein